MSEKFRSPTRVIPLIIYSFFFFGCLPSGNAGMVQSKDSGISLGGTRADKISHIKTYLAEEQVRERLEAVGLNPSEVEERISRLNDQELSDLAVRLDKVKAGEGAGLVVLAGIVAVFLVVMFMAQAIQGSPDKPTGRTR